MHVPERLRRDWRTWGRPVCGALVVVVVLLRVGPTPFVTALHAVSGWAVLTALAITVVTTVCAAWRWSLVAATLGLEVPVPAAIAAYYRSQLLNSTLPGGVVGDVHRAVREGRDLGAVWRTARSVAWERVLGQVVQVLVTVLALVLLATPLRPGPSAIALGALTVAGVAWTGLLAAGWRRRGASPSSRVGGVVAAVVDDLRRLLAPGTGPAVAGLSVVAVAGHTTLFVVAAHAVGVGLPFAALLVVALVVLLAAALPTNLAGWGPREGVAAWAFGMVGAGAAAGVSVAALYGVLSLLATLPGAVLLVVGRRADRGATSDGGTARARARGTPPGGSAPPGTAPARSGADR